MNEWALSALLCFIYTFLVGGLALKRSPKLIKIVKMKLGQKMPDQTVITICLVMAGLVGVAGIILLVISLGK